MALLLVLGTGLTVGWALSPLGFRAWSGRDGAVMKMARRELLENGGFEKAFEGRAESWGFTGEGYVLAPGSGRSGGALACRSETTERTLGACQTAVLNRSSVRLLRLTGWSRAENVSGAPDDAYSLYATLEYDDGSRVEKIAAPFDTGTHDWQRRRILLPATRPVRSVLVHCLFREHSGQAWFDDLSLEEETEAPAVPVLQGAALVPPPPPLRPPDPSRILETGDGLRIALADLTPLRLAVDGVETRAGGASGFLARDVEAGGAWRRLDGSSSAELGLSLKVEWRDHKDHLSVEGELVDTRGRDRAVSMILALPFEARSGVWWDDARRSRPIQGTEEFVSAVPFPCGSTASISRYPVAAVSGLALGLDPERPAQFRLGYHAGLGQLFAACDFGLVRDSVAFPGRARFRFVVFRIDAAAGFRDALRRYYSIFPNAFANRCTEGGSWLPFVAPDRIRDWEDFGFAFHEKAPGTPGVPSGPLQSYRYTEPLGLWMALPAEFPRAAGAVRSRFEAGTLPAKPGELDALRSSAMKDRDGRPVFSFKKTPWCDGVLWSMNPNPDLPGESTAARLWWNPALRDEAYGAESGPAGEFVDSAEGYAMADLDYDPDHLRYAGSSASFCPDTFRPVLFKDLMMHDYVRALAGELRGRGKFVFANGTPHRSPLVAPWCDILGHEVDWFPEGRFAPPPDDELSYWRAMAFQKPLCVLLNTRADALTSAQLELFFQRCLFYGIFPGFFSHDAHHDAYWEKPGLYERDRPLFRKYVPLIRRAAIAGWQPVTAARCDNAALSLESFGPDAKGVRYLSVLNSTDVPQTASILLRPPLPASTVKEWVTGDVLPLKGAAVAISLPPGAVRLLEIAD